MLLLTLATRACLAVGGLSTHPASPIHLNSSNMTSLDGKEELWSNLNGLAILNPLAPHWQMLTEPGLWLEATIQVRITWRKVELSSDSCVFFLGGSFPSIGNWGFHCLCQLLPASSQHGRLFCLQSQCQKTFLLRSEIVW